MLDLPDTSLPDFDSEHLEDLLGTAKSRSRRMAVRQRRHRFAAAGLALLLVAGVVSGVVAGGGAARHPQSPKQAGHAPVSSLRWRLVSSLGSEWHVVGSPSDETRFRLVCPTASTCYAVGFDGSLQQPTVEIAVTTDGGQSWQSSPIPSTVFPPGPFSCVDASTCAMLGTAPSGGIEFDETTDGGQSWTTSPVPAAFPPLTGVSAMSCSSAEDCVAAGQGDDPTAGPAIAVATTDGGQSWTTSDLPSGFVPYRLACSAAGSCTAVGAAESADGQAPVGAAAYSGDGGVSWTTAPVPSASSVLIDLSCGDASNCLAAGLSSGDSPTAVLVSSDGGQTWTAAAAKDLPDWYPTGLSCPASTDCWLSGLDASTSSDGHPVVVFEGSSGLVASSTDGGQTWQQAALPNGVIAALSVDCPDTTTCYALGFQMHPYGQGSSFVLLAMGT